MQIENSTLKVETATFELAFSNTERPISISGIEIFYSEGAFSIPDKEISNTNMPFSISDKEISNMNMQFSISVIESSPSEGDSCIPDMKIPTRNMRFSISEDLLIKKMTLPRRPRRSRRRNSPKAAYWQWMNADPQELIRSIRRLLNKRRIIQLSLVRFHIFFAPPYRTNNSSAKA